MIISRGLPKSWVVNRGIAPRKRKIVIEKIFTRSVPVLIGKVYDNIMGFHKAREVKIAVQQKLVGCTARPVLNRKRLTESRINMLYSLLNVLAICYSRLQIAETGVLQQIFCNALPLRCYEIVTNTCVQASIHFSTGEVER